MITHMPTSRAGVAALHQRLADEVADLPESGGWQSRGLCRAVDPNVFHPDSRREAAAWPAKLICSGCPIADRCREEALSDPTLTGIWGATSELDRKAIIKQRRWDAVESMIDGAA